MMYQMIGLYAFMTIVSRNSYGVSKADKLSADVSDISSMHTANIKIDFFINNNYILIIQNSLSSNSSIN